MKEWEVLSDEEYKLVWGNIYDTFKFNPKFEETINEKEFLELPKPFKVYDMHLFTNYLKDDSVVIDDDYYNNFNKLITDIFINCMGTDEFLYVLDWQHSSFRYNPKSEDKMPRFLETEEYNIYFPDFYPDGDYYLFVAKDLSWGYFTHPWKQELWIFGEMLLKEIEKIPSIYLTLKKTSL